MISFMAAGQEQVTVLVEAALVAGAEPALGERLQVGIGIVVVARRDVRSLDHDLADRALRQESGRPRP